MAYQIKQKSCSCCHFCKTSCPAGAIRFKGTKYWIDPEKCIDCGQCVDLCNNDAISEVGVEPTIVPHDKITKSCDIVVAGGGAAGLIAAAKAGSEGHSVILLEKMSKAGGSCWFAGGYRTYYSNVHKANGIEEDPRDRLYEDFVNTVGAENIDTVLLKRMLEANGEMLDWIYEKGDMKDRFRLGTNPWGQKTITVDMPNIENNNRIDPTIGPGSLGSAWVITMTALCKKFGVEIITGTAASKLVLDSDGKLTKVLAKDAGGEYEINCKAAVMATGAFTHGDDVAASFRPEFIDSDEFEPVHKFTAPGCTGDGIKMCEELGADIDRVNFRCGMFGPAHHPFPYPGLALTRSPYGLVVNMEGNTFHSEPGMVGGADALMKQPRHICYQILDQNMVEQAADYNLRGDGDRNGTEVMKNWRIGLEEEVALEIPVKKADTIEELAVMIGAKPEVLKATVEQYNAGCPTEPPKEEKRGGMMGMPKIDIPFGQGPYYAFFQKFFHENAIGGMTIDSKCRVLKGGEPIPGIYAAGDTARGVMVAGPLGVEYVESVVTALTAAVTQGYMSGDEVSKYLK